MTETPTLNEDQQAAADAFFRFLMTDARSFVLSGSAGTGKTFLMGHLCKAVMKDYEDACKLMGVKQRYHQLAFTATTNKASEVLEQALGLPVKTLHSFMGLKPQNDYNTGKSRIEKTRGWSVQRNLILFIDECSMIDADMLKMIDETFIDCKIVYVGDHAQMAPVGEKISQVFNDVDPDNFIFLRKAVRNSGQPALMALCAQLRETVETGVFRPIQEVPGVIDYLDERAMPEMLETVFSDPNPSCRVLCYTNERVRLYNQFIREVRSLPEDFCPGDQLVVASTYTVGRNILNVEREVEFIDALPELHSLGYETWFEDGQPIQYRQVRIKTGLAGEALVNLCTDPERLQIALKELARQKRWRDYYDLKEHCIDLRDKAACTVYKSQGSTYDSVFVDIGNISTSYDAEQVARMLFVAISRARSRVFLHGRLSPQYRGK